jgi:hypothetical protein
LEEERRAQALEAERQRKLEEERRAQALEAERQRKLEEERQAQALEAERQRKLEEERQAQAVEAAFRQSTDQVARMCQQQQWEQARQLLTPHLDHPKTKRSTEAMLSEITKREGQSQARQRELEGKARTLIAAKQYQQALAIIDQSGHEFPQNAVLKSLSAEARGGLASEQKGQRLGTAERAIRSLLAERRFDEALTETVTALSEDPDQKALRDLRAVTMGALAEKAAVSGVAREVQRMLTAGDWTEADRMLVEALRRYPGSTELENLRPVVDAARNAKLKRKSGETRLKSAISGIGKLLGRGKPPETRTDSTAPGKGPGTRTTAEAAQPVTKTGGAREGDR